MAESINQPSRLMFVGQELAPLEREPTGLEKIKTVIKDFFSWVGSFFQSRLQFSVEKKLDLDSVTISVHGIGGVTKGFNGIWLEGDLLSEETSNKIQKVGPYYLKISIEKDNKIHTHKTEVLSGSTHFELKGSEGGTFRLRRSTQ